METQRKLLKWAIMWMKIYIFYFVSSLYDENMCVHWCIFFLFNIYYKFIKKIYGYIVIFKADCYLSELLFNFALTVNNW